MAKKTDPTPKAAAPAPSYKLRASVPIPTGAAGWTGGPVAAGDTLETTDGDVFARLQRLAYGRAL